MRQFLALVAAWLIGSAATLSAQTPGTVELGGFGQATLFDEETTLTEDPSWGAGGLLGVFVAPNLALEGTWSRTWTEDASPAGVDGTWDAWRARLVYGLPVSYSFHPLLGVGYVRNDYADAVNGSDDGITSLLGFKAYLSHRLALRSDLQFDYVWEPFNESSTDSNHSNYTLSAGLSVDLGAGRARDSDGDGVRDREDACADTPLGVSVSPDGCRLDGDGDGVFDEDDMCGGTPAGVQVDADGCRVDTDGDGVFDEDDMCGGTPAGVQVDADGCRVDTDGDGVFDEDDMCEGTPAGVQVDANGCRADEDGDGVFDEEDMCRGTPLGAQVDPSGCRVDTDGDGVFDEDDNCPTTQAGVEVDASGCPVLFEPEATAVVLEGVTFEFGSAVLTPEAQQVLDRVAESLVGNPDIRVQVAGHTDSTGPRAYNVSLSQDRADSVMQYLIGQGVAADRMEAVGYGPDRPVADNDTAEGRQQNRRVELERIN